MPHYLTEEDVADFRIRLRDTAAELLAELGYAGFTMRELATRLNISSMTAYRYFHDKDEILAAVRAHAFCRLADRLEAAPMPSGNVAVQNFPVVEAYTDFAHQDEIYYRLMFDLSQTKIDKSPESELQQLRARTAMTRHVRDLVERGVFEGDPELISPILWSMLHGVVALHLAGKLHDTEFHAVLTETVRVLARGFAPANRLQVARRVPIAVSTAAE